MTVKPIRLFDPAEAADHPASDIIEAFLLYAEQASVYAHEALIERQRTLRALALHLGSDPLAELTPETLYGFIAANARWKSNATRKHKAQQVLACFNWAARVRRLAVNPFAGVRYVDSESRRPVTEREFFALLRVSEANFRRFLLFLWYTGMRQGEARSIVWPEVDLAGEVIVKQRHKSKHKTRKPRVIVVVPQAVAILKWLRRGDPAGTGEVFKNQKGRPWKKEALVQKLARLRKRYGLAKGVLLHGVRHSFGTRLVKRGENIKLVSLAMGHASVAITERYYVHLDGKEESVRNAIGGNPGW